MISIKITIDTDHETPNELLIFLEKVCDDLEKWGEVGLVSVDNDKE